jgi:hypothetical protein
MGETEDIDVVVVGARLAGLRPHWNYAETGTG